MPCGIIEILAFSGIFAGRTLKAVFSWLGLNKCLCGKLYMVSYSFVFCL